ncbi:MAG: hypothetical protein P8074_09675 [Anaerolineales bacterium]|jgi:hypothetical protein
MKFKILLIFLLIPVLTLSACSTGSNVLGGSAATPVAQPESGMTTLMGHVQSRSGGEPLANVPVRLAEVYRQGGEGAFVLDGAFSPGDVTDEQGNFVIENVEAREYVIVVGDVNNQYEIIPNAQGDAKIYTPKPDNILEVGDLEVNLPQP